MRLSLRPCALSPARSFAACSLMACLLLQPSTARAGTYAVSYSGGTIDETRDDGSSATYSFGPLSGYYSGGGGVSCRTGSFDPAPATSCSARIDDPAHQPAPVPIKATFTWTPASGQTALTDPPPPSAVVWQYCKAQWSIGAGTSGSASGGGSASNGLGSPVVVSASGADSTGSAYSVGAGGASFSVTCAPAATFTGASGTATHSYIYGSADVDYSAVAYPITLASPDPLGRPDLGDGKNQFVYTADTPDGYLYVPGAIQVTGAPSAAVNWLINNSPIVSALDKVNLTIDSSIIPNTFTHQWAVSGNTIYVNTPQDVNNPYPSYQFNHWIFKGLPSDNSGFGNHTVNLLVQGAKTQTAEIQTFFPKDAQNFPGCDPVWDNNWYHYYNKAYPSPDDDPSIQPDGTFTIGQSGYGECAFQPPLNYDPMAQYGYGFGGWLSEIHIFNQAGGSTMLPIFDLGGLGGRVRYVGRLYPRGIHTYILTCAHETAHRTLMQSGIYYPYYDTDGPPFTFVDKDGDHISDTWEQQHHLDPTARDTTGYFEQNPVYRDSGTGDLECLCEILALKSLLSNKDYWKQDWSDLGLQHGAGPEPDFYWKFVPSVTSSDYIANVPCQVRSLADLSNHYPTVLTDLP